MDITYTSSSSDKSDLFVGIRSSNSGLNVQFPKGLIVSEDANTRVSDARALVEVFRRYRSRSVIEENWGSAAESPIVEDSYFSAYIEILEDFIKRQELFTPVVRKWGVGCGSKIDWGKTFKTRPQLLSKSGVPVYIHPVRRTVIKELGADIRHIHEYCLSESARLAGWLFNDLSFPAVRLRFSIEKAVAIIGSLEGSVYRHNDLALLQSMRAMLLGSSRKGSPKFIFGTYYFQYYWEWLVNDQFGNSILSNWQPRARWTPVRGESTHAPGLNLDSLYTCPGGAFVVDAKYYSGVLDGRLKGLPGTSDLAKQFHYIDFVRYNFRASHVQESDTASSSVVTGIFVVPWDKGADNSGIIYGSDGNLGWSGFGWLPWRGIVSPADVVHCVFWDVRAAMLSVDTSASHGADSLGFLLCLVARELGRENADSKSETSELGSYYGIGGGDYSHENAFFVCERESKYGLTRLLRRRVLRDREFDIYWTEGVDFGDLENPPVSEKDGLADIVDFAE